MIILVEIGCAQRQIKDIAIAPILGGNQVVGSSKGGLKLTFVKSFCDTYRRRDGAVAQHTQLGLIVV